MSLVAFVPASRSSGQSRDLDVQLKELGDAATGRILGKLQGTARFTTRQELRDNRFAAALVAYIRNDANLRMTAVSLGCTTRELEGVLDHGFVDNRLVGGRIDFTSRVAAQITVPTEIGIETLQTIFNEQPVPQAARTDQPQAAILAFPVVASPVAPEAPTPKENTMPRARPTAERSNHAPKAAPAQQPSRISLPPISAASKAPMTQLGQAGVSYIIQSVTLALAAAKIAAETDSLLSPEEAVWLLLAANDGLHKKVMPIVGHDDPSLDLLNATCRQFNDNYRVTIANSGWETNADLIALKAQATTLVGRCTKANLHEFRLSF